MKLIMLSGGLDSTAALYKLLTETRDPLHVHHIVIRNIEQRWEAETRAIEQIIPYLQNVRPFTFTENLWGVSSVSKTLFLGQRHCVVYRCAGG